MEVHYFNGFGLAYTRTIRSGVNIVLFFMLSLFYFQTICANYILLGLSGKILHVRACALVHGLPSTVLRQNPRSLNTARLTDFPQEFLTPLSLMAHFITWMISSLIISLPASVALLLLELADHVTVRSKRLLQQMVPTTAQATQKGVPKIIMQARQLTHQVPENKKDITPE